MNSKSHIKTFLFLSLLIGLPVLFGEMKKDKKFKKGIEAYQAESENAREIYTGKIRDVYDPLDEAYIVTNELKELKETSKIDISKYKSWPVISVWANPKDLYSSERGIITNGYKTGRLWERASFVRFYLRGEKVYESYAGLRQHGGTSRAPNSKHRSFRLYFRKKYGEKSFIKNLKISQKEGSPIKRLVIRKDLHYSFGNDLAFYLIRSLGGDAPYSRHVAFFLNGKLFGYHTITEHISPEQLKYMYGHEDFAFAKVKGKKDLKSRLLYLDIRDKLERKKDLDFDYVNSVVDMDSMMSSLLTIMFTGNTDWSQGAYIKDLKRKKAKWKIISWDFDRVAHPVRKSKRPGMKHNYEMKSLSIGMDQKKGKIRWSIFNRLIHKDQKFRVYFKNLVDKLIIKVKSESFKKQLEFYQALADESKDKKVLNSIMVLKEFFQNRTKVFCQDLKRRVSLVPDQCHLN